MGQQLLASSTALSATTREMSAKTCKMLAATRTILAVTWFFQVRGGARGASGENPPHIKKHHWLKVIFRPWGTKKNLEI